MTTTTNYLTHLIISSPSRFSRPTTMRAVTTISQQIRLPQQDLQQGRLRIHKRPHPSRDGIRVTTPREHGVRRDDGQVKAQRRRDVLEGQDQRSQDVEPRL